MAEANPTNLSDDDPTKTCDLCSLRGVNALAGTYCQVCSEYLCLSCEEYHRSSKASRDHELKPLEESQRLSIKQKELSSSIMACDVHRTETLTYVCISHKVPICIACKSAKHRKCDTTTLKRVTKEAQIKTDVSLYIDKSKALLSEVKDIKDSREKEKCLIQDCSRKCFQEVKRIKLQIIAWAEKLTRDMEEKIANKENQLLAELEGDIKAVIETSKQMQYIVKSIEILGQDIEDATCVLIMKEKGNIEDGIEMKDDILKQVKPVKLGFQQSDKLVTLMAEITSMGNLDDNEKHISKPCTLNIREHQLSFQDISSTTTKNNVNAGTSFVSGCTFMPDGELVICGGKNMSVKVFTNDFKLKNELQIGSRVWDVAVVSSTEVIVTQPDSVSLQIVSVSKDFGKGKRIPVGLSCYGIDCKNEKIYISCQEHNEQWTYRTMVRVITMNGVIVNTFYISKGLPSYLAVNSSGDRILVSTRDQGVVCIDNYGYTLFKFSGRQENVSSGLLFDSYNNFMVCDDLNSYIDVVKSDGTLHRILLSCDDGLMAPSCLAYRPSDNTLVVGQPYDRNTSESLLAFTIK